MNSLKFCSFRLIYVAQITVSPSSLEHNNNPIRAINSKQSRSYKEVSRLHQNFSSLQSAALSVHEVTGGASASTPQHRTGETANTERGTRSPGGRHTCRICNHQCDGPSKHSDPFKRLAAGKQTEVAPGSGAAGKLALQSQSQSRACQKRTYNPFIPPKGIQFWFPLLNAKIFHSTNKTGSEPEGLVQTDRK